MRIAFVVRMMGVVISFRNDRSDIVGGLQSSVCCARSVS